DVGSRRRSCLDQVAVTAGLLSEVEESYCEANKAAERKAASLPSGDAIQPGRVNGTEAFQASFGKRNLQRRPRRSYAALDQAPRAQIAGVARRGSADRGCGPLAAAGGCGARAGRQREQRTNQAANGSSTSSAEASGAGARDSGNRERFPDHHPWVGLG